MPAFTHILVATDFSEASRCALDLARRLARESGAALTIAHTCEMPAFGDLAVPADLLTPVVENARSRAEELVGAIRDECPRVKAVVRVGAPWEQILAAAEEVRADLIVMGTHGRRGLAHALIGSVAERVIRLARIPVLTVASRAAATPAASAR